MIEHAARAVRLTRGLPDTSTMLALPAPSMWVSSVPVAIYPPMELTTCTLEWLPHAGFDSTHARMLD
jgi:hypothetical protein